MLATTRTYCDTSALFHRVKTCFSVVFCVLVVLGAGSCGSQETETSQATEIEPFSIVTAEDEVVYRDKVHGSWVATMVANHSGLLVEGIWLDEPGPDSSVELVQLDEWSTDDDTHVEWLDLHILETYGLDPTYQQIRDEWVDHLNGDIWVATRAARDLMDDGVLPPATGSLPLNPEGAWAMDAQLETELFGLINPGQPEKARDQARFFAQVTSSGPAVDASAFYAHLYSMAFSVTLPDPESGDPDLGSDVSALLAHARAAEPDDSIVAPIYDEVLAWHVEFPDDWRATRERIKIAYDTDPEWWASRVNFASTVMALLYGEGDLRRTVDIAGLAGWDADNNMTTSAGLLGLVLGYVGLPEPFASASDIYFNQDLSGDLPRYDSVSNIARRTADLGLLNLGPEPGK